MSDVSGDIVGAGARVINFKIENRTGQTLFLSSVSFVHGRMNIEPPPRILDGQDCNFSVCSRTAATVGVEGTIKWSGLIDTKIFSLYFNKPFGSGATKILPGVDESLYSYNVSGKQGGLKSNMTITFSRK